MAILKRSLLFTSLAAASLVYLRFNIPKGPSKAVPVPVLPLPVRPRREPDTYDDVDETVTPAFTETAKRHPIVKSLRHSVGMTEAQSPEGLYTGSTILLDQDGALAMTGHQVVSHTMKVKFLPHPSHGLDYLETTATLMVQDRLTDVSYWQLDDPDVVHTFDLEPVHWGHMGNGEKFKGLSVVGLGFPGTGEGHLSAEMHAVEEYLPAITVNDRVYIDGVQRKRLIDFTCKMEASHSMGPGESGGGIFDDTTGEFLGTISAGNDNQGFFTPVDAIWNGYVNFVQGDNARWLPRYRFKNSECEVQEIDEKRVHGVIANRETQPHRNFPQMERRNFLFLKE